MTRKEAKDRFNSLPIEHRVTVIASEMESQIRFLEHEKTMAKRAHNANMDRITNAIKRIEKNLDELKD